MDLTPIEQRVLGALVEKQMTTPEHYPLTTNALIAAANQASNRDPVTDYDETEVLEAVTSLRERELVRSVKRPGDRVMKHRHDADRTLRIDDEELAVLAVLLLRGPQTPGELRSRTERYTEFGTGVDAALDRLAGRDEPIVTALERRPGQKEARWAHLLGPLGEPAPTVPTAPPPVPSGLDAIVARLEALEASVDEIRGELGL
jgi:uncharacterized protein YceH (UPF0502 family)